MNKGWIFLLFIFIGIKDSGAQSCDCRSNFEWLKKTVEENDAGFQYALEQKGNSAYELHNRKFESLVDTINNPETCLPTLREWLKFFRSKHLTLQPIANLKAKDSVVFDQQLVPKPERINLKQFRKYLDQNQNDLLEGIWAFEQDTIGIRKEGDEYIGRIIASTNADWNVGAVKLKLYSSDSGLIYHNDNSAKAVKKRTIIGKTHLLLDDQLGRRVYPEWEDDLKYTRYLKSFLADRPYIEEWDSTTLYIRIPSFDGRQKHILDSLLFSYQNKILATPNLIIDIRNNTGGSDASFAGLIPYLYTNPIRSVGVAYFSTPLNNQRMLDFVQDSIYGLSDEVKKWAEESYWVLQARLGEFVNLRPNNVMELKLDTVYKYPQNVGVIVNNRNVSTAEQFLLAVRQSRKVKIFGKPTSGGLDISNMYFVPSPCKEFSLGYGLTRSLRIPDFTIDDKGIQPDFYIDDSIPDYDWVPFVVRMLHGK